jgi:hypothetical protein
MTEQHLINHLTTIFRSLAFLLVIIFLTPSAYADVRLNCDYRDTINNGTVDFGSGKHSYGSPEHSGNIAWSFLSFQGVRFDFVRVTGTLYLDKLGSGLAGLIVDFKDDNGNVLRRNITSFPGPGNNANATANKHTINTSFLSGLRIREVQLTLGEIDDAGNIIGDAHTGSMYSPDVSPHFTDRINHGSSDFGGNSHAGGGPSSDALIDLFLRSDGVVFGSVNGVLYWDDLFSGGTTRMTIDFRESAGQLLARTQDQVPGLGGNANSAQNKILIDRRFASSSLSQIIVKIGKVNDSGNMVDSVSKTYSFKCPFQD